MRNQADVDSKLRIIPLYLTGHQLRVGVGVERTMTYRAVSDLLIGLSVFLASHHLTYVIRVHLQHLKDHDENTESTLTFHIKG